MNDPEVAQLATSPYPGLRPFHIHEVEIFFGREEQTDQLLNRLQKTRLLAIVGPSGCGKSSLVRAGMIAALQTGLMSSAGSHWRIAQMRPGERPLRRLAAALAEPGALDLEGAGGPTALAFADATLRRGPLGLEELLQERWLPEGANLLLLVDQFEEIFRFRQEVNADEADAFVALLLATAARATFPVYVVLTMRSDFLGECALFQGLPEAINDGQYLTPRMTREQIRSAIVGPARVFDADVEPTLASQLLNEVGADPDQLPLLQHALMRMWQQMQARVHPTQGPAAPWPPIITMADYHRVGSIARALTAHADQVYETLTPAQQRIAEVMFRRLTHRATGKRDTRRPARLGDVAAVAGVSPEEVAVVVEEFRRPDRSFVTPPVGVPLTRDTILDIGHESLIRQWDRLNEWVDKEARTAEMYLRLVDTVRREGEGKAMLWRSAELQEGLQWREHENPNPPWAMRYGVGDEFNDYARALNFLDRSLEQERAEIEERERSRREREELERQRQAEREQRLQEQARAGRRFRSLSIAMAVLALIAGGAAFQAWRSEKNAVHEKVRADAQADLALARQLNAEAQAKLNANASGPERVVQGLLLTLASLDASWTPEAYATLVSHMDLLPPAPQRTWESGKHELYALVLSPDGRWIATGGQDGTAIHATDGKTAPRSLETQHHVLQALAFSPDSRWLAAGCGHQTCIYDTQTWNPAQRLDHGSCSVIRALSFSPDGSRLASMCAGSQLVKIYETRGWKERTAFDTHSGGNAIALGPNGQWLAISGSSAAAFWGLMGEPVKLAEVPNHGARLLAPSPAAPLLAIGDQAGAVQLVEITTDKTGKLRLKTGNERLMLKATAQMPIANGAFSADGRYLAVPDGETVRIGDVTTGREIARLMPGVSVAAFGADGRLLAGHRDGTLAEWDLARLADKSVQKLEHDDALLAVAFSPDGSRLATVSGTRLRIFEASKTEPWKEVHRTDLQGEASDLHFSRDGRWLVIRGDSTLQICATPNWRPLGLMKHDGPIARVALSPDGKWLSTHTAALTYQEGHTGRDRTLKTWVWDATTGAEIGWMVDKDKNDKGGETVRPPSSTAASAPTAGGDTTLVPQAASWQALFESEPREEESPGRRWLRANTAQGTKLSEASQRRAENAHPAARHFAFSGDGQWLASAGEDRSVQLWHLVPEDLKRDACSRLPRNLTCAEWRESLGDRPYARTCADRPDPPDPAACGAPGPR